MNLTIDRLRLVATIARLGTLAAAAQHLGVSTSAASQQLSAIERDIGAELFVRQWRSLEATPVGRSVADAAVRLLAELERSVAAIESQIGELGGEYSIAAPPSVALKIATSASAQLLRQSPNVSIKVVNAEARESIAMLQEQAIDLALVDSYDAVPITYPDDLDRRSLGCEPLLLVAPTTAVNGGIGLADLATASWVLPSERAACGMAARAACRAAGFEPAMRFESNDLLILRECVRAGLGYSLLPRLAVTDLPDGISAVLQPDLAATRTIVAVTRASSAERPVQQLVLECLMQIAADALDPVGST